MAEIHAVNKLVSVIIPTFGRSGYLPAAVRSVLTQTYGNLELIIVDDNGEGTQNQIDTKAAIKPYLETDQRIHYLTHDINRNGSAARNTGIGAATGEYLCFLDDDDLFYPQKIEKQVALLESLGVSWGACYTGHERVFENGYTLADVQVKSGIILMDILTFSIDTCAGSTLMIRKSLLRAVQGFDTELNRHQDYEFMAKVAFHTQVAAVGEVLVSIRMHHGSYAQKAFDDIVDTRLLYIKKISPILSGLDHRQRRMVQFENYYTLVKSGIKAGKMLKSMRLLLKMGSIHLFFARIWKDAYQHLKFRKQTQSSRL